MYYLRGPLYINGLEYWEAYGCSGKFTREDFEEELPAIPRREFLQEFQELLTKYNASIETSYEETCVCGTPLNIAIYVGAYEILKVNSCGLCADDLRTE